MRSKKSIDTFNNQEFYFVRHGQTDHNILKGGFRKEQPEGIALNAVGREQAEAIEPIISALPVETVCFSPLRRVQETKEIIPYFLRRLSKIEHKHDSVDFQEFTIASRYRDVQNWLD